VYAAADPTEIEIDEATREAQNRGEAA
jgi:hypothetical protein